MDKDSGERLPRCSKPHRIVMCLLLYRQKIANMLLPSRRNVKLLPILLLFWQIFGCTSYIKELPIFPEAKILKIYFPMNGRPNTEYMWKVWANTATDSLEVKTYVKGYKDVLLTQYGKFIHEEQYPVSGLENDWMSYNEGRFELQFRVWNQYTEDFVVRWIDIKNTQIYKGVMDY